MKKVSLVLSIVLVSCLIVVPVFAIDSDGDGIPDEEDNCPSIYNPNQEDTMPPGGNNCGDICECELDFDGDGDIDGTDLGKFKQDYFRIDCSKNTPCNGDFDCNGIVDAIDANRAYNLRVEFFRKDCPSCGGWPCVYE